MNRFAISVACALCLFTSSAEAQLAGTASTDPAPPEIAASLKALLAPSGIKVTAGSATTLEFWWVSELPISGGPAAWSGVAEGALVGAVRVTGPFREIRGKTIKPGVYTLRFGLQPQNGDHLGASPFREFLLLSPAAADTDPKPLGFDGAVAIAKQSTGSSHPGSLSLDPPLATAAPLSKQTTEPGLEGLIFEVKSSAGPLRFGLILIGKIEH